MISTDEEDQVKNSGHGIKLQRACDLVETPGVRVMISDIDCASSRTILEEGYAPRPRGLGHRSLVNPGNSEVAAKLGKWDETLSCQEDFIRVSAEMCDKSTKQRGGERMASRRNICREKERRRNSTSSPMNLRWFTPKCTKFTLW